MTAKKTGAEANLEGNAPKGIALTDAERADAMKEGAKEDVKEAAKDTHRFLTDGNLPSDTPPQNPYHGHDDITLWADILDLGVEDFEKRVSAKKVEDGAIPEEKAYGLLALERNGKNRTPYVKALMKRLGITKREDIPGGGPDYTNDVTPTTKL